MTAVLDQVRAGGLLDGGEPLVVLCSGGRDSVCLLDVAAELHPDPLVLHVNYGLRGPASDGDEQLVRSLCERLGVPLQVERPSPNGPPKGNLHAWARELRYAAARRLGGVVATGHTATDQAETILYRLAASPGRRALLGMAERDGDVVRPLLRFTREQTAAHCRARELVWREDAANDDPAFARARVRNELLPALRRLHPAAEANIVRTAELLRAESAVLDAAVGERERIALAELAALPAALARLVVARLAEDAAGWLVPGAANKLGELLALADLGGTAMLDVGGGVRAVVEYGVLRMEVAAERPPPPGDCELAVPGAVAFGPWRLESRHETANTALRVARADDRTAALDAAALSGALAVRGWRPGDRMAPLGMDGTRTLADLFTDRKIARVERADLPVVVCDERIAWVPGVATDRNFAICDSSPGAVVVTARR